MTTGEIRLSRRPFGFAAGRIMNEKLVVIQAVSVLIRGASSALPKDAVVDVRHGDFLEPRPGRTPHAAAGPRSAPGGCVVCVSPSPLRAEGWGAGHGPPSSVRRVGLHLQCAFRPASRNCSRGLAACGLKAPLRPRTLPDTDRARKEFSQHVQMLHPCVLETRHAHPIPPVAVDRRRAGARLSCGRCRRHEGARERTRGGVEWAARNRARNGADRGCRSAALARRTHRTRPVSPPPDG